jgi:RND family efflux transporter MFP subunit
MNKRIITITVVSIVFVGLIIAKLLSNKEEAEKKIYIHNSDAAVLVEGISPSMHTFESSYNFLGTFEAYRQNTISADAQGKLIKLSIEEGDRISKGQVIAKIDDELLRLQLENAEVALEGQKNDDARYTNLGKDNVVSGVQVEKTKLGLRSAEIQKSLIEKQLRSTTITAPFSGVVTKKMVDLGSFIGNGTPIAEITDISSLKLTISVPERDILKFKLGQSVELKADIYGNRTFSGNVSNISVQADKSHNFKIQITVPNQKQELMAGMYGSASLNNDKSITSLSIPRKALIGSSKNPQVYVIRNGKSILTSFSAGTSDGEFIEVISGLSKSDLIVIKGQVNLQNNSKVKTK